MVDYIAHTTETYSSQNIQFIIPKWLGQMVN